MINSALKVALVTGATSKFGQRLCKFLFQKKWNIILHHFHDNTEILHNSLKYYDNKKYSYKLFQADFNNPALVLKNFNAVISEFGYPSLVINNASVFENDKFENLTLDKLENNINVHFKSPMLLTTALLNYHAENKLNQKVNIINILDYCITAYPKNKFLSYSLSKMMMANATKLMALNLAPSFRTNAIAPSPFMPHPKQNIKNYEQSVHDNPLNYKVSIKDILSAIEFLNNNQAINGEIIHLDGGRNLIRSEYY